MTRDSGRDEISQKIIVREMPEAYIGNVVKVKSESLVVGIPDCEEKEDEKIGPKCDKKEKINGKEMIKVNYSVRV